MEQDIDPFLYLSEREQEREDPEKPYNSDMKAESRCPLGRGGEWLIV